MFSGVLVIIVGVLIFLKNDNLAIFFERVLKKINSFFKNEERSHLYTFIGLIILSILLRVFFINKPLNYQEAYNFINYSARSFFNGALKYDTSNNFVLNSIFISIFNYVFGENLWALRFVSFISGILLCPAIYLTGRIYFNKFTALIASGIVAASPILIVYSTTSTGLSLFLLIIVLFFAIAGYLKDRDEVIPWVLFVILSVLGFICSPLFFYPFFSIFLWLLISGILKVGLATKKLQVKKVLIYSISSVALSYIFYIPEIMKNGIQNILTLNFPQASSFLMSLKSLILNFNISWSHWNIWLPIFLGPVFIITILLALIFFKKESKHKYPVIIFIVITLLLAVLKRINFHTDAFIFILPVLILMASQGIYFIFYKIFYKKINFKPTAIAILSILIAIIVFSTGFINNFVYSINDNTSPPEVEEVIISLKNDLTSNSKISVSPPFDYFFMFYGSKYGVPLDDWNRDLYSSKEFFIFQNKDSGLNEKTIIDEYFKGKSAHVFGFTEPVVFKDFELVTIYKTVALETSEIPVLDYDTILSLGVLQNISIHKDKREISFDDSSENILKMIQVPINLEKNTDYLISLEIRKDGEPGNNIIIDFFGYNYDYPAQEFSIFSNEISHDYTKFVYVLNSGEIPANTQTFFRIFSKVPEQFHIKNVQILKVLDN